MTEPLIFCIEHPGPRDSGILFPAWLNGYPVPSHPHFAELAGDILAGDIVTRGGLVDETWKGDLDEFAQGVREFTKNSRLPVPGLFRYSKTSGFPITSTPDVHLNYITQTYDEISAGTKYVYPILANIDKYVYPILVNSISIAHKQYKNSFLKNGLSIQKEVLDDCRSGRCKILIHDLHEAHGNNLRELKMFITAQSEILQVPLSCFGFLDGNPETPALQAQYGTAGFYMFDWESFLRFPGDLEMEKQRTDILNKKFRPYHFINLNSRPRTHRLHVVTNIMTRWADKILFSCNTFDYSNDHYHDLYKRQTGGQLSKKLYNALPIILDNPFDNADCQARSKLQSLAYINLTSETYFFNSDNTTFLTEKIFKPIIFMQPFIVVGPHHSLQRLKDMGYQTFSPLINESYDNEKDPMKRLDLIYQEIERLTHLSHQQMQDLVFDTKEILFHNFENIKNRRNQLVKEKQLIIDLQEWVNG